jgi:hypothetical protein
MKQLARLQSEKYNSWKTFEKTCRDSNNDPLRTIAELTLEVGRVSGRKVVLGKEDVALKNNYDM